MIGGSLIVGISLLALGWASEIVGIFVKNTDTVWPTDADPVCVCVCV